MGGTLSGLTGTVVLQDNGGDNLTLSANGTFAFATLLAPGATYNVTVATNPAGKPAPSPTAGARSPANVTNVAVTCVTRTADGFSVPYISTTPTTSRPARSPLQTTRRTQTSAFFTEPPDPQGHP